MWQTKSTIDFWQRVADPYRRMCPSGKSITLIIWQNWSKKTLDKLLDRWAINTKYLIKYVVRWDNCCILDGWNLKGKKIKITRSAIWGFFLQNVTNLFHDIFSQVV